MPTIVPTHEDHRAVLTALEDGAVVGVRRIIARDRGRRRLALPRDHEARVMAALRLQVQSGRVAARKVGDSVRFSLTRDGKKALRRGADRRSTPVLAGLVSAASAAALLAGCATTEPPQQSRVPLMGYPTPVGMQQVRDQLGRPVYEPCSPCATPSPKTPVLDGKAWDESPPRPSARRQEAVTTEANQTTSPARARLVAAAAAPVGAEASAPVQAAPATPAPAATRLGAAQVQEPQKTAVLFGFASSKLSAKGRRAIAEFAKTAAQASAIYVRGATDSTGDPVANEILARNRAAVVRAELIANGVPRAKVKVSSCASCYLQDNGTEGGRRANRRVDLSLAPMAL